MNANEKQATGSMTLLPPPEGHCIKCARRHHPGTAHDAQSLYYQVRFRLQHGRDGTWADAVAHCSEVVRQLWEQGLRKRNAWSEPPQGVDVIAEPSPNDSPAGSSDAAR